MLSLSATSLLADDFPSHPLRVIVPYAAGGPSDTGSRLAAEPLSRELGKPVVVENRGGGGGLNATEAYFKMDPDGYTILVGSIGPLTIIPAFKPVTYDVDKDVVPLSTVWRSAQVLAVRPSLGVKTVAEFVAYAKAHPKTVTIGSAGIGAVTHLAIEVLKRGAGIDVIHVPFRSTSESMPQLIGGQIDALVRRRPDHRAAGPCRPYRRARRRRTGARQRPARGTDHGGSRLPRGRGRELVRLCRIVEDAAADRRAVAPGDGDGAEGPRLPWQACQARRQRRHAGTRSVRQTDQGRLRQVGRHHQGRRHQALSAWSHKPGSETRPGQCLLYLTESDRTADVVLLCLVLEADIGSLFDHLVGGGEQRRRHGEAKHPGGLVIDDQLELRRLHDRQVCGLGALEDARGIDADLAIRSARLAP